MQDSRYICNEKTKLTSVIDRSLQYIGASTQYKVKLPSVTPFLLMESSHQSGFYGQFSSLPFPTFYCPLMRDKDHSMIFDIQVVAPAVLNHTKK
ncbi:hypothetical protein ACEOWJ_003746 [Bacillus cereus]|uniref:hypothetical protein n=1 Tax=Bacillus TaxID=1386 RepID=UPI00114D4609|nr:MULTISPECIES: hypothetical protein [unclassified Bacillus (in: firmicutes)]